MRSEFPAKSFTHEAWTASTFHMGKNTPERKDYIMENRINAEMKAFGMARNGSPNETKDSFDWLSEAKERPRPKYDRKNLQLSNRGGVLRLS